ncbi:MAG: type IV pilus modification PilV family protein [Candidatus Aminicenantaceae bacterium]
MKNGVRKKIRFLSKRKGFSLIEVLVGMFLVSMALLGFAQLFTLSLKNNMDSDHISNASFLAQRRIDALRSLTKTELDFFTNNPIDETIDVNQDGTIDFRRIVIVTPVGMQYRVRLLVFQRIINATTQELIDNPRAFRVKTDITTIIGR